MNEMDQFVTCHLKLLVRLRFHALLSVINSMCFNTFAIYYWMNNLPHTQNPIVCIGENLIIQKTNVIKIQEEQRLPVALTVT